MTELLFIRHAATDLAGTFCGHTDPDLNEEGTRQAAVLLTRLENSAIDHIYSSDLRRAYSTALILARNNPARITTSTALREICFGTWEGLTWAQIEDQDPLFASQWLAQHPLLTPPNAEQLPHFRTRVQNEITRIEASAQTRRIAIVTHAGVMREVLQNRCGLSSEQAWGQTCEYCCTFTLTRPA